MSRYDVRAWLVWLLAAAVLTMLARNPFYTLIILLVARIVDRSCGRPGRGLEIPLWRFGVLVLLFSGLFNVLFVHVGQTVLLTLPAGWPLVGGPLTLEAFLFGLMNGLVLLALFAIFLAFNASVPISELIKLAPRTFHDLGVVVLIAVTYVPETVRHLRRIREAQAVRGHQLQGLRDWRPVIIPLLVGGMERAMTLAEAMVARGYGATGTRAAAAYLRAGLVVVLLLALVGWALVIWQGWAGWLLLGLAAGLLLLLIRAGGRDAIHTEYRPRHWRLADTGLALSAALSLALVLLLTVQVGLSYSPYPRLTLPPVQPAVLLALLLLVFPAVTPRLPVRDVT